MKLNIFNRKKEKASEPDSEIYNTRYDNLDNNINFGTFKGKNFGLSLDNRRSQRSQNVLVIGGTGTGKSFKYVKPNLLSECFSCIASDPSGELFDEFAPYLISRGYNVYLFNVCDFTFSNHYNPLLNVYNPDGSISETKVDILVKLYMDNAKASAEAGKSSGDPFWDTAEKAFFTSLVYYTLESDEFGNPAAPLEEDGEHWDKCFSTVLKLSQQGKVKDNAKQGEESPLRKRMDAFFERCKAENKPCKTRIYFDTVKGTPEKTLNTIVLMTAVDLQIFANKSVDFITRLDYEHPHMNIDLDKLATQQTYLFLGMPTTDRTYNMLLSMLFSQLFSRLYDLGNALKGKWHIGYNVGTPVFEYFDSEEEAIDFYEHISKDNIVEESYINNTDIYHLIYESNKCKKKTFKTSLSKLALEKLVDDLDAKKMCIWCGNKYMSAPALPIHVNAIIDEFANVGEIPDLLKILATCRKYRLGIHAIIQNIGQAKSMYKDEQWSTLFANVDTTLFLGSINVEDKEYIQKMLGKTTINQKSTSSSKSGNSVSGTPTQVDLMSIDEISALNSEKRDDCIVMVRDVDPYVCRKLNLLEHPRYKYVKAAKNTIDLELYFRNNNEEGLFQN